MHQLAARPGRLAGLSLGHMCGLGALFSSLLDLELIRRVCERATLVSSLDDLSFDWMGQLAALVLTPFDFGLSQMRQFSASKMLLALIFVLIKSHFWIPL